MQKLQHVMASFATPVTAPQSLLSTTTGTLGSDAVATPNVFGTHSTAAPQLGRARSTYFPSRRSPCR